MTSLVASSEYFSKLLHCQFRNQTRAWDTHFSLKSLPSFVTSSSNLTPSALQDFAGLRTSSGTLGQASLESVSVIANLRRGLTLRNFQIEDWVGLVFDFGELATVDGIEDGSSVFQGASLSSGGSASTDPASVEQPCVGVVVRDLVGKHLCVPHGMQSQERLSKARRKGCLRLSDTILGTSHLGGVARDEMEHGLVGVKFRDWW